MNEEKDLEIEELIEELKVLVREFRTKKQESATELDGIESKIEKINEIIISKMNNE
jgi:hypothetical protein